MWENVQRNINELGAQRRRLGGSPAPWASCHTVTGRGRGTNAGVRPLLPAPCAPPQQSPAPHPDIHEGPPARVQVQTRIGEHGTDVGTRG